MEAKNPETTIIRYAVYANGKYLCHPQYWETTWTNIAIADLYITIEDAHHAGCGAFDWDDECELRFVILEVTCTLSKGETK